MSLEDNAKKIAEAKAKLSEALAILNELEAAQTPPLKVYIGDVFNTESAMEGYPRYSFFHGLKEDGSDAQMATLDYFAVQASGKIERCIEDAINALYENMPGAIQILTMKRDIKR